MYVNEYKHCFANIATDRAIVYPLTAFCCCWFMWDDFSPFWKINSKMVVTWLLTPECFQLSMLSSFNQMACVQMLATRWCCGFPDKAWHKTPDRWILIVFEEFGFAGAQYVGDGWGESVCALDYKLFKQSYKGWYLGRIYLPTCAFKCSWHKSDCVNTKENSTLKIFHACVAKSWVVSVYLARKMARCQGAMWIIAWSSGLFGIKQNSAPSCRSTTVRHEITLAFSLDLLSTPQRLPWRATSSRPREKLSRICLFKFSVHPSIARLANSLLS